MFEARMVMLRTEFEAEQEVIKQTIAGSKLLGKELLLDRGQMKRSRQADSSAHKNGA
jgi:hypothetical protein